VAVTIASACALLAVAGWPTGRSPAARQQGFAIPSRSAHPVGRFECDRPAALRLLRFEDGSAQLLCAARLLARIASPG
jgi:hypothetical protein